MKNSIKTLIICAFAAFTLFSACETIIDFDDTEITPLLVVNSFVMPDSTIIVEVSESKFFLASEYYAKKVTDANVQLFVNDEFVEQIEFFRAEIDTTKYVWSEFDYFSPSSDSIRPAPHNSVYVSKSKVKSGDKVKIKVSAPNFKESVWGETVVPFPPQILSFDTVSTQDNYYDQKKLTFSVKFQDNPNEDNYYRIILGKYRKEIYVDDDNVLHIDSLYRYETSYFDSDDMLFTNNNGIGGDLFAGYMRYYIFSDELIKDKEYTVKFEMWHNAEYFDYYPNDDWMNREHYELEAFYVVKFQTISKEYYQFLKSANAAANEDITGFFSEPTQIFSNINGGIGVIGAYAESAFYVNFH
ncbi:MAG: DUF4249 domain-containing protein [Prevotellaceae bacterium]|jgi:hypothetical protein|nr:DUF4249 domain-containing protein [Prevotellaceae bacterium]